jgi:hypothetical protein
VFFAENVLVHAGMFFGGVWLRNLIVLAASGTSRGSLVHEALVIGPLQAASTAVAGVIVLYIVQEWLAIRLDV